MTDFNEATLEDLLNLIAKNKENKPVALRPTEMIMSDVAVGMVMRGEIDPPEGMRWIDAKTPNTTSN